MLRRFKHCVILRMQFKMKQDDNVCWRAAIFCWRAAPAAAEAEAQARFSSRQQRFGEKDKEYSWIFNFAFISAVQKMLKMLRLNSQDFPASFWFRRKIAALAFSSSSSSSSTSSMSLLHTDDSKVHEGLKVHYYLSSFCVHPSLQGGNSGSVGGSDQPPQPRKNQSTK